MPSSRVKDFAKNFNPGKVIAVRLRRFAKNARTRRNSTTTRDHEGDDSISADVPSEFPAPSSTLYSNSSLLVHPGSLARDPGLEVSINISSATSSHRGESSAHKASDMAQTFLPFVQSVAGAIPLAGPPMQATISGLLSILQAIDRRSQNKADLDRLTLRLHQLSSHLCNVPTPQGPFEQYRRDAIIRMLQDISAQVAQLYNRGLAHTSVTQAIIGCSSEIDRYLVDYSWSSQMQSHHDILEVRKTLERQQEILMRIESVFLPGRSSVGRIVTLGFVTLVDATDRSHPIPMDVCDSFERFNEQLQLLFKHNSVEARIQRQYMEEEQYDLCIDDDKQVTRLTSCEWPSIAAGTTIVMRVIFEQKKSSRVDYRCHFCGAVNDVGTGSIMHSLQRQAGCSINCRVCKRRFQISCGSSSAKRSTQSSNIDCVPRTEAEMHLIRNFHIQQMLSRSQLPSLTIPQRLYVPELLAPAGAPPIIPLTRRLRVRNTCLPDADAPTKSRSINEEARDFNAGGASATVYSHRNGFLGHGSTISPQPSHFSSSHDAEYGYIRFDEIEEDSNDDYDEDGMKYLLR